MFRLHLIDDWCVKMWRLWSVWAGAAISALIGILLSAPEIILSVMNSLPPDMRAFVPPFVSVALVVALTIIRLLRQGNRDGESTTS